jgi:hypothetical protein
MWQIKNCFNGQPQRRHENSMTRMKRINTVTNSEKNWNDNVNEIIEIRDTKNGIYLNEKVVHVYCQICAAEFIGPIREAGGFLGGHDCYHRWEMLLATLPEA